MSLRTKYQVSMAVSRLATVGNKADYAPQSTVIGHIQPLDSSYAALIGGNLSKSFMVWVPPDADIEIGDKIVIATGDYAETYFMKEEKKYALGSAFQQHKEIIIEEKDA